MKKVLVLLAHPNPSQSQLNRQMKAMLADLPGITVVDLYALYPRFKIDIDAEQQRLLEHDVVVFQFPLYWYSTPALLKEWQDLVLEHGFAYGEGGNRLAGKLFLVATTAGGAQETYSRSGGNHFTLRSLLTHLEQTAQLCQMRYLPPFVQFSSLAAGQDERGREHVAAYRQLLEALRDERLDLSLALGQELMTEPAILLRTGNLDTQSKHHG